MAATMVWTACEDLPRAHGEPLGQGLLRAVPEDFQVVEDLGFAPDGDGAHWLLRVRKTGLNTEWVARQLARWAAVPVREVGYAGLKDRHAVAEQWFSLPARGDAPLEVGTLALAGLEILDAHRHRRKLRRGALAGNRFRIRVRGLTLDPTALAERIDSLRQRGVPNYFGEQRFGHDRANLARAEALFAGRWPRAPRHPRALALSAARSQLFNELLAERVRQGHWDRLLPGECVQLDGTQSHFVADDPDETLRERCARGDLHPSGPLWGAGDLASRGSARALELGVAAVDAWREALAALGLEQARRALRVRLPDLTALTHPGEPGRDDLELTFRLPAGAYATAVLRECCRWELPADRETTGASGAGADLAAPAGG